MEHIEEAGIHSGDSACALPPVTLGRSDIEKVRAATEAIAHGIGEWWGLLNVQYALKDLTCSTCWEAQPRASRTVPFVSVRPRCDVPLGQGMRPVSCWAPTISQLRGEGMLVASGDGAHAAQNAPIAVKEAVLPFHRFRRADGAAIDLAAGQSGRWKSTGEVMGIDRDFGSAFAKSHNRRLRVAASAEGTIFSVGGQPGQALIGVPGQAVGGSGLSGTRHRGHCGNVAPQRDSVRRGAPQAFRCRRSRVQACVVCRRRYLVPVRLPTW